MSLYMCMELLLSGAIPLVVLSLAQMFIIGLGHVDLGMGYFMGIVNVICATWLYESTAKGVLGILIFLLMYACMGLVIYYRNIPAVITTLGASFIWKGIFLTIQDTPGGNVPEFVTKLFHLDRDLPVNVIIIIVIMLLVLIFYRSKYGTVMKGFGNNGSALVKSGWSAPKAYFSVYLTAGIIAVLAGVVLGGTLMSGGKSTVIGTVFGCLFIRILVTLMQLAQFEIGVQNIVKGIIIVLIIIIGTPSRKKVEQM